MNMIPCPNPAALWIQQQQYFVPVGSVLFFEPTTASHVHIELTGQNITRGGAARERDSVYLQSLGATFHGLGANRRHLVTHLNKAACLGRKADTR